MNTTDLIGKRVGKLTVVKFDRIEHKRDSKGKNRDRGFWLCKCDCGNFTTIARSDLVSAKTKSCGCLIKENGEKNAQKHLIDLTGKRFNELVVVGLAKKEKQKLKSGETRTIYYWRCKCDCGNEIIVSGKRLKYGKIKNCEDYKRNELKSYTQIGNEFKRKNILKEGTRLDNICDKVGKANTTGVRGVSFKKDKNKFRARIGFKGKDYHLGYYNTVEEARKVREKAEEILYKPILEKYNYKPKNARENGLEME